MGKRTPFIYVSGLPRDVTVRELADFFSPVGIIYEHPNPKKSDAPGEPFIRIYTDDSGKQTGDALIRFARDPAVPNAILLRNGVHIRPSFPVTVTRARFESQQEAPSGATPRARTSGKRRGEGMARARLERLLSWDGPDQREGFRPKTVILRNMFTREDLASSLTFVDELREDIKEECEQIGRVKKIRVITGNDLLVTVRFYQEHAAKVAQRVMDGRFFDGRRLQAELWDGVSEIVAPETHAEQEERFKEFVADVGGAPP